MFDEADRTLDMGFEKEITQIISLLKTKFAATKQTVFEEVVKIVLVLATTGGKISRFIDNIMGKYPYNIFSFEDNPLSKSQEDVEMKELEEKKAEFEFGEIKDKYDDSHAYHENELSIPESILQMYCIVPMQYKLLYFFAFLFLKRNCKVIVFTLTCQNVNYLYELCKGFEWHKFFKDRTCQKSPK